MRYAWVPLLVMVVGVGVYHNSFRGPFIFDDVDAITENPHVRRLWPLWDAMAAPPESPVSGRPIVSLSFAINYALGGTNVWGYHAVNLAIHVLNALLLVGIVRRTLLGKTLRERFGAQAQGLALAVALLWLVHPLLTEAVNYITQRTELLMALFFLSTLYCVIRMVGSSRYLFWGLAAVASCALGTASKQVMVSAPLLVLLYDRTFLSGSFREALRRRWVLHGALASTWIILLALASASRRTESVGFGFTSVTPLDYALRQCGVILHYLRLSLWPHPLVLDYAWPAPSTASAIVIPAACLGVLVGATLWALYRRPPLGFLGAWFFLILAPTSSFLPIKTEIAAERRMYLPLQAVAVLVVLGADSGSRRIGRRRGWQPGTRLGVETGLLCAAVATLAVLTIRRNDDYSDAIRMWTDVVAKQPANYRAHNNLGALLYNLAGSERQNRLAEAKAHFVESVRLKPDYSDAQRNLGFVLEQEGDLDGAILRYREAVRIRPGNEDIHDRLARALLKKGRAQEAVAEFRYALRLKPAWTDTMVLLAWVLATSKNGEVRDGGEAVALAERACSLGACDRAWPLDALAAAYAEAGRFDEAVETGQKALDVARGAHQLRYADDIAARIALYRMGQPYHGN